jgi:hypothetical protein
MKQANKTLILLMAVSLFIAGTSCDKNNKPTPPLREQELITTLKLTFINGSGVSTFQFRDIDGDGGNSGTTDTIRIQPGKTYQVSLDVLDESKTPTDTVTNEIKAEKNDHIFCYLANKVPLAVSRTDKDDNNREIGITSNWTTVTPGAGLITIILKHQPGIKDGTCDPGDTDIQVTFPVKIQ